MNRKRFYLLSLGCAKNTVDSESMAQLMAQAGYEAITKPERAEVLIVNTCGFIGPARQESLNVLRELADAKRPGQLLIAAGCLPARIGMVVAEEVPGLDGILSTRHWMDIVDLVSRLRERTRLEPIYELPETGLVSPALTPNPLSPSLGGGGEGGEGRVLRAAVQGTSAYLKIADGCRRPCAFCSIPLIKGTAVSRPPETIVAEAARLVASGVKELILIAQDTTDYGHDLGLKDGLAQLLDRIIEAAPDVRWLRMMYAYPGYVTPRLIATMARYPQICHYLDIPLQHGHPRTLYRMRRPSNIQWVYQTLASLRAAMPDIAIRTTFIVGYPGETEEEFQALLDFVADLRFDRLGCFTYSFEPGTPSAELPDQVPEEVKEERRERLMALQQGISLARNQAQVGRTLEALIEGQGDGLSIGRTYRDAPEVDGLVLIPGDLPTGEMLPVRITGATEYDLIGTVDSGEPQVVLPRAIELAAQPSPAPPR